MNLEEIKQRLEANDVGYYADRNFIAHARQDIPTLIAEVERLREALAFYADPRTHKQICSEEPPEIWVDEGKIARQALEGESNG